MSIGEIFLALYTTEPLLGHCPIHLDPARLHSLIDIGPSQKSLWEPDCVKIDLYGMKIKIVSFDFQERQWYQWLLMAAARDEQRYAEVTRWA